MIDKGILCMAQNNQFVNYARLAYLQRLSLKLVYPDIPYAIVTDQASIDSLSNKQQAAFDHVIILDCDWADDQIWKQRNDWQLFHLSPFRETIKVEADLLFTRSFDHWWPALRHRDLVLATGCKNFKGELATSRAYRKIFDANFLPDTYSGLMYWRYSKLAADFFSYCQQIYSQWNEVKSSLLYCDDPGSNDLVFSLAARIIGEDLVTLPALDFRFVHMKSAINNTNKIWTEEFNIELNPPSLRLNTVEQYYPFHYHEKDWVTDSIIERYEKCLLN